MRLNRLRVGETVALAGALGLLFVMSLRWYDFRFSLVSDRPIPAPELHTTGWAAVGWFALAATIIAIAVCLLWLLATATHDSPALPVAGEVITIGLGLIASIALLSRLVFQPGLGIGLPNPAVDLLLPAYLGPLFAIALTVGAWLATADERTEAQYSQPGEVELRPIPD